ncbi:MAG: YraN family protein [Acidimicrobiia bacterium]
MPRRQRRGTRASGAAAARRRRGLGARGEAIALAFLRRRGARLIASNVRSGRGEIDLLVRVDGRVVAVEVKTRVNVDPLTQMTELKHDRLRRAAHHANPRPTRIDVIAVMFDTTGATIRWVRGI